MFENKTVSEKFGYECIEFTFEGRKSRVILPKEGTKNGKWLLKTEYADAFPAFEIEMLGRGYCVAYVENKTRWMHPSDIDVKAKFAEFLHTELGLSLKCVPVGMSCGGLHAVYFAAKYPEHIAAIYLDAPVMNLLSCPGHIGVTAARPAIAFEEFTLHTGMTLSDLINYRNHPIDRAPDLLRAGLPIIMVAGDSDGVVPYCENGQFLEDLYRGGGGEIEVIIKKGCDHHPHGLEDNTPIINFVEKHYK